MDGQELAGFLRSCREARQPADVGMELRRGGRPRRTPGLRREEVADLAGVSVDYYERLEQARASHPSSQVVDALADALRLPGPQRGHLFRLAGYAPPPRHTAPDPLPGGVIALLDRLTDMAAYVCDARYDVLAWNTMASALIADFAALPPEERNVLRIAARGGNTVCRGAPGQEGAFARQAAAELRGAAAHHPRDARLARLVEEFGHHHPEFADSWAHHEVGTTPALRKHLTHPELGTLELDCQTLRFPDSDLRLVLYSAEPGTDTHDRLARLRPDPSEPSASRT
ncbi:helix-turn-helix transcriptional regulator [Haloactinospora alba]|uniref:helix-turn-helix transcriptional regulator n=1 Tax=Haloactinospora alba TaxID=405555 RepID=UPI0011507349|nr:helix-turn-helix transcriptional regulator [Haloactinospora alba]